MSERAGWWKRGLLAGLALAGGCFVWGSAAARGAEQESAIDHKAAEAEERGRVNREEIAKKAAAAPDSATYAINKVAAVTSLATTRRFDSLLAADAPLRVRWSLPLSGGKIRRLTVPAEESGVKYLLVETEANDLIAVRRDNGEALWWVKCAAPVFGDIFVGSYSVMFVSSGRVVRLERMSGDVVWNVGLPFAPSAGPCAIEDTASNVMVFVPGMDRGVYGFDVTSEVWPPKESGSELKKQDFSVELKYYRPLWKFFAAGVVGANMLYYDNRVFTGCWNDRLYGLNLAGATMNGRPEDVWEYRPRSGSECSPSTDGMYIFFASLDNNVYCMNRQSGSLIWRYVAEDRLYATPLVVTDRDNEKNYLIQKVGKDGALVCLRREDGVPLWQAARGVSVAASLHEENSSALLRRVLVINGADGSLSGVCVSAPDKRTKAQKDEDQKAQRIPEGTVSWSIKNLPFTSYAVNVYDPYVFALTQDGTAVVALEKND